MVQKIKSLKIPCTVPALRTDLEVYLVVQHGAGELFYISHIPHSSSEIYPYHLGNSGKKSNQTHVRITNKLISRWFLIYKTNYVLTVTSALSLINVCQFSFPGLLFGAAIT